MSTIYSFRTRECEECTIEKKKFSGTFLPETLTALIPDDQKESKYVNFQSTTNWKSTIRSMIASYTMNNTGTAIM